MDFSAVIGVMPEENTTTAIRTVTPVRMSLALSMDAPRAALEPYRNRAKELLTKAYAVTVKNADSQVAATNLAAAIKKDEKAIEDARKAYTAPINDHIKAVNGLAKEITTHTDEALRYLTGQLNQYATRVELERRKAEEEARKQAKEEQKRLDAEAKEAGVQAPVVPEIVPAKPEKAAVRTENGTSYQRKTWTFEPEKIDDVPREYMMLNEAAVRAAIKNGVRSIPGLRIFETTNTVIR